MAVNLDRTLRVALAKLTAERARIERRIAAVESALGVDEKAGRRAVVGKTRARKRMSAAARKTISRRMKAYWAKRRAQTAKQGRKAAK